MSVNRENRLRIALTKGRLLDKSMELFTAMGLDCTPIEHPGRRLVHAIPNYPLDAVLAELERRSHKIGNLKQMKTVDHET